MSSPIVVPAGTGGSNFAGVGTVTWSSTGNIAGASDGAFATTGFFSSGAVTQSADGFNYNVSIPSGQTVTGIQLDVVAKKFGTTRVVTIDGVQLIINGVVKTPTTTPVGSALSTTAGTFTAGSSSDLWGFSPTDLTQATINNNSEANGPTASIWFIGGTGSSTAEAMVDSMTLSVYFAPSGGGANQLFSLLGAGCGSMNGLGTGGPFFPNPIG
ncbi:MAG TPA: hypothetical protein VFG04_08125 [Planctomycetaceae bacterium]|jgi:hypothetical protein|nr:hypothetical protein [Planctomycetaceae bacterium]